MNRTVPASVVLFPHETRVHCRLSMRGLLLKAPPDSSVFFDQTNLDPLVICSITIILSTPRADFERHEKVCRWRRSCRTNGGKDQPRGRGGDLSLRLCGVSRRQRQLNKAISFPVVCRKQLSAAASAAATTRSPWSSISSVLIGLRHTAARRHTRTHADGNRRINAHARNRNMGAHTQTH